VTIRTLTLVLVALAAAGCRHGGTASTAASAPSSQTPPIAVRPFAPAPVTRLHVAFVLRVGTEGVACPAGMTCRETHPGRRMTVTVASYALRCPAAGRLAATRCNAIWRYLRLLARPPRRACSCPAVLRPDEIRGVYRGRPVRASMSPCTTCEYSPAAARLVRVLTGRA
jgi:hypothetical protein